MFSGGKDSCYAVWIVQHQAWDVARLITVRPESRDSWMFHHPNVEWTGLQARSMGLEHSMVASGDDELSRLEEMLRVLKSDDRLDGLVTGAVASDFQKARFDSMCERLGLRSFSPLWHKNPERLVEDLMTGGFRIIMSGVAAAGLDRSWLGRELTPDEWGHLREISRRHGLHLSGEGGEYETFVVDAPQFTKTISITESEKVWSGQSGYLNIRKALLSESN
jgi:diphthine-ammonia ligase